MKAGVHHDLMMGLDTLKEKLPKVHANLIKRDLSSTHQLIAVDDELDLEKLFKLYQGENWSPNGEAKELVISLGLQHTSINIGDIVQQGDNYYFCDVIGWAKL